MHKSPLIILLKTLSPEEKAEFRHFLLRPDHKRKKLPLKLLDFFLRNEEESLESGTALQELYPGQNIAPQRLRRVMMELRELLHEFIASRSRPLTPQEMERELRILRFLLDREQHDLFLSNLEAFFEFLAQSPFSAERELAAMQAEQMRNEYIIHNLIPQDTFENVDVALDAFYLARKLETWCSMRTREKRHPQRHHYMLESLMETMLRNTPAGENPLVKIWWRVYLMESSGDREQYLQLASLLTIYREQLPHYVLRQVHGYMFNFLIRTQMPGRPEYYQELWELLRNMLEQGTMHLGGRISQPFFLTTVRVACLSGETRWATEFIHTQAESLAEAGRQELLEYCRTLEQYYSGKLTEAWKKILTLRTHEPRLELYVRLLQLQLAFDLGKQDEFFRYSESFRKFLERKSSLGERFTQSANEFHRLADRLARAVFSGKKASPSLLREIRQPEQEVMELLWLARRCGE